MPSSKRFAALAYSSSATSDRDWTEAESAVRALGLHLGRYDVGGADDFAPAFAAMAAAKVDALLVLSNQFWSRNRQRLMSLVAQYRLPSVHDSRSFTAAGGLMSYGANTTDLHRRAAGYVDKILKGAKPADLPVEQPTTFDFVVNLATAHALGLTIPQSVVQQATEVIQ